MRSPVRALRTRSAISRDTRRGPSAQRWAVPLPRWFGALRKILGMASPFVLDVGDLLTHPGRTRPVEVVGPIEAAIEHARIVGPVVARLRLEGLTGGVFVRGEIEAPIHLVCNRCLTEWEEELVMEMKQLFASDLAEDVYAVEGQSIDLENPIRDEVFLVLPQVSLCRENCPGLCASCGADLNTAPCQGHDEEEASPFAVLKDLLSD